MRVFLDTLDVCDLVFSRLESGVPDPIRVPQGDDFSYRYEQHTPKLVVVQKLSRVSTGLKAALALMDRGLYQEVGAIFRMLDEFREDVSFMCVAIRSGSISEIQQQFIDEFFQEEFDSDLPIDATQRRNRVPRRRIQAALAGIEESELNPSDSQELARTIANANSGYVHGTSEHILDMYGGDPPHYYLDGMLGTRRQATLEDLLWTYVYRGLLSFMEAAMSFGIEDLVPVLYQYRDAYERHWGRTEWRSPEELIREMRRGAA